MGHAARAVRRSADPTLDLLLPVRDPAIDALHAATALYTRDPVVDEILDLARWPHQPGRLLDPGAGDGVFIERAVARLPLGVDDVLGLAERVEAWEIHPEAAAAARTRLVRHLLARGWQRPIADQAAARVIVEADFLTPGPVRHRYTVVAGNPPYLRWANLPEAFKVTYGSAVPDHARADLLHAFLDRCATVLTSDGRLACVTADRWLFNASAGRLREVIGTRFGVAAVKRLDTATAFYRPKVRRSGTPPRVHPVAVLLAPAGGATRPLTRAPIYPDGPAELQPGTVPLGEVADVRLAPWLGPHGVFTLDAEPARTLAQMIPPELRAAAFVPCVDTADIDGDTLRVPTRVALRTHRDHPPHRAILAHLDRVLHHLPPRARRTPRWASPENWGALPLAHDSLLVPRIARGLRVIRLPADVLPVNHNLSVVAARGSGVPLDVLARALASDEAQAWIQTRAPRLENGYLSITTNLLRRLPIRLDRAAH